MDKNNKIMFALLRSAICAGQLTEKEKEQLNDNVLTEILTISKQHDLAHLVGVGLEKNNLLDETLPQIKVISKEMMKAVFRYQQINYEYQKLCIALESAKIPFLPLKGAILRAFYPEPWMRTSCDIDILVHEKDLDATAEYLVKHMDYINEGKSSHDISMFTPNKVHIELHYDLVEDWIAQAPAAVLKTVWQTANLHKDSCYWNEMSDEMFYFYHIAHMAKHFEIGGCGIRPLIDLWILDHLKDCDLAKCDQLLEQGNMLKFAESARMLSNVWLGDGEHNDITRKMETYILEGGLYGSLEQRVVVAQQRKGGKWKYLLSRMFLSKNEIKFYYPILQKHYWLMPIMQVCRWFRIVFCYRGGNTFNELKYSNSVSDARARELQTFLKDIGL